MSVILLYLLHFFNIPLLSSLWPTSKMSSWLGVSGCTALTPFMELCGFFVMIWTSVHAETVAFLTGFTPLCLLRWVLLIVVFSTISMDRMEGTLWRVLSSPSCTWESWNLGRLWLLEVTQNWTFFPLALAYTFIPRLRKAFDGWTISYRNVFIQNRMSSEEKWKNVLFIAFKTLVYKHLYLINFTLNYSSD